MVQDRFDVRVLDTTGLPDYRLYAALACADLVLVPTRLDNAWIDAVCDLFRHDHCGIFRIHDTLNPSLRLLGLLPMMVESGGSGAGHRQRFAKLAAKHPQLLIGPVRASVPVGARAGSGRPASLRIYPVAPRSRRPLASGAMLWELPATSARAVWNEIRPSVEALADRFIVAGFRT